MQEIDNYCKGICNYFLFTHEHKIMIDSRQILYDTKIYDLQVNF